MPPRAGRAAREAAWVCEPQPRSAPPSAPRCPQDILNTCVCVCGGGRGCRREGETEAGGGSPDTSTREVAAGQCLRLPRVRRHGTAWTRASYSPIKALPPPRRAPGRRAYLRERGSGPGRPMASRAPPTPPSHEGGGRAPAPGTFSPARRLLARGSRLRSSWAQAGNPGSENGQRLIISAASA